jgi:hypothetical protein
MFFLSLIKEGNTFPILNFLLEQNKIKNIKNTKIGVSISFQYILPLHHNPTEKFFV